MKAYCFTCNNTGNVDCDDGGELIADDDDFDDGDELDGAA